MLFKDIIPRDDHWQKHNTIQKLGFENNHVRSVLVIVYGVIIINMFQLYLKSYKENQSKWDNDYNANYNT